MGQWVAERIPFEILEKGNVLFKFGILASEEGLK